MTATATFSLVAGAQGSPVTARDRVAHFLVARPGAFCDACAARALGIDPSTAYRAAEKIARAEGFVRHYSTCSECGTSRLVTAHCDRSHEGDRPQRSAPRGVDRDVSGTVVACHDGDDARPFIAPAREEGRLCQH
jgi:hypothetical protein